METRNENAVQLAGKLVMLNRTLVTTNLVICEGTLQITRESGVSDYIPILFDNTLNNISLDSFIAIKGQFRSRDIPKADGKIKVQLYVYVKDIVVLSEPLYKNEIELNGYVCKQPTLRNTPTGKQIADLLVACNFSKDKSAYIPVISWGREARKSGKYIVGTEVKILGRIQSRKYTKIINEAQEEFVAYELSANQIDCVANISD